MRLHNTIIGGGGDDTLMGGGGVDRLNGGGGDDLFRFDTPTGLSVIRDFEHGADHIQISAAGFGHGLTAGTDVVVLNAASAAAAFHSGADGDIHLRQCGRPDRHALLGCHRPRWR